MHFELSDNDRAKVEILLGESELLPPTISLAGLETLCGGDEELEDQLETMLASAVDYTETVAEFKRIFIENSGEINEEFESIDKVRTSIHNRTMAEINALSRLLGKKGKSNEWMLAGGMDGNNRAAYGKFAILITLSRL